MHARYLAIRAATSISSANTPRTRAHIKSQTAACAVQRRASATVTTKSRPHATEVTWQTPPASYQVISTSSWATASAHFAASWQAGVVKMPSSSQCRVPRTVALHARPTAARGTLRDTQVPGQRRGELPAAWGSERPRGAWTPADGSIVLCPGSKKLPLCLSRPGWGASFRQQLTSPRRGRRCDTAILTKGHVGTRKKNSTPKTTIVQKQVHSFLCGPRL